MEIELELCFESVSSYLTQVGVDTNTIILAGEAFRLKSEATVI